jgi:nitroreductase
MPTTETPNSLSSDALHAFEQVVATRRSVRAYLPQTVPMVLQEKIFTLANQAPSNCNTRPWFVYVVSGARREALCANLVETVGQGEMNQDYAGSGPYRDVYRKRQVEVGLLLYQALGIKRDDKAGRHGNYIRNLQCFGAPHVAFILMPDWAGIHEAVDVGIYAQNLMLMLKANGIASCPQGILGYHAGIVRQHLSIDKSQKLLFGISFGYEDKSKAENQIQPAPIGLNENTWFFE